MSIQTGTTETENLRRRAEIVRDETNDAANTAQRIGQLLIDIVDNNNIDTLDNRYLRKDMNDKGAGFYEWEAGWMTHAPVRSAEYNIGWEAENPTGWYVSETGDAWYSSMNVRGPILSNNVIGSPYYASGWTGYGSQWDMNKHFLETDFGSFRKEIRAKMFVIDQIRGTNGSLAVSDSNKILRVEDMGNVWRCYIDTYGGDVFMNMRVDDAIKCQRVIKYYLALVTNVSSDYFDLSKTNLEGTGVPEAGDEVIRWDNISDLDRKGIVYLTASDSYAPYMDVRYGDWDATQGVIKVRNGRLDGISDPAFPELYGDVNNFGLYTCNFYGTGELILRSTGESVSRTFEVLRDQINMGLSDIRYEIQVSKDSVLVNPAFQDGTNSWEVTNVFYPWTINGTLLQASNRPFMNFVSGAILVNDPVNNRTVLQVSDSVVTQRNAIFTDRTPGKYVLSFYYRSLLSFGSLEIGVPGSALHITQSLSEDAVWKRAELSGDWDGTGDFIIRASGTVNIMDISFTSDRLTNAINQVKVEYDTKLSIKADKAELNSFRDEYDEFNRVVRRDYATQTWTATKINTEVGTIVDGKLTNYATQTWTSDQISSSVSDKASTSYVDQKASSLTVSFNNKLSPITGITDAFYKFDSSSMMTNRRVEVGSGQPGNFTCQGGISPNVHNICFWAGTGYWGAQADNAKVLIRHDGSGYLGSKCISWDTKGNAQFKTASSGSRIHITPDDTYSSVIQMYDRNNNLTVNIQGPSTSGAGPQIVLRDMNGNNELYGGYITARGCGFSTSMSSLIGLDIGIDSRGYARIAGNWYNQSNAPTGNVYEDNNGFLKVKR